MGECAMSGTTELYAALLAREFPAQALLRFRTDLRSQPCVVMQGQPPLQQVASLNVRARQLGIVHGMTKVEVETFPDITVLRRSLEEENLTTAILLEHAGEFSPRIENCSESGIFLCVIDIAGTEKLFGLPMMLARSLLTRAKMLGIVVCVAISRNFHAAIALAKGIAARHIKIVPIGEEAVALAPLPLMVLDLTEEQMETFSLWGIRTLGALAELPEKELIARLGQEGKCLRQLARGEMPHLFQPVAPGLSLQEKVELESSIELLDTLMFVVNVMLEQLILRAASRFLALASVTIKLTLEGHTIHARTVCPALPTNDRHIWLRLLHLDVEAHPPQAKIIAVALEAEPGSTSKVQFGLFSSLLPEPSRLDVTLARISALVGEGNVGRAVLEDTNQTDGFSVKPFRISTTRDFKIVPSTQRPAMRMLRPAEATFVTLQNHRPKTFTFRDRRYIIEQAYGPWLASGEWWTSTTWGCEQWDLVARGQNGCPLCCCLMSSGIQDGWRIVALYD
jgi:protein ImuB